jgi:hypothetical protein
VKLSLPMPAPLSEWIMRDRAPQGAGLRISDGEVCRQRIEAAILDGRAIA